MQEEVDFPSFGSIKLLEEVDFPVLEYGSHCRQPLRIQEIWSCSKFRLLPVQPLDIWAFSWLSRDYSQKVSSQSSPFLFTTWGSRTEWVDWVSWWKCTTSRECQTMIIAVSPVTDNSEQLDKEDNGRISSCQLLNKILLVNNNGTHRSLPCVVTWHIGVYQVLSRLCWSFPVLPFFFESKCL